MYRYIYSAAPEASFSRAIILMFEVVCEDGLTNLKYVPNAVYYRVYLLKVGVSYKLIKINVIVKITDRSAIKCFLRNLILWKIA